MRIVIDTTENTLVAADGQRLDLYGKEAFELISDLWLKSRACSVPIESGRFSRGKG
jgi:hypothetical protein